MLTFEEARQKTNMAIEKRQTNAKDSVLPLIEKMNGLILVGIDKCESVATMPLPELSAIQINCIRSYYIDLKYGFKCFDRILTIDWCAKNTFDSR